MAARPDSSSDEDPTYSEVPDFLKQTPEEAAGSIPGSTEATAAALTTHRRAVHNKHPDPYRRGPPKKKSKSSSRKTDKNPSARASTPTPTPSNTPRLPRVISASHQILQPRQGPSVFPDDRNIVQRQNIPGQLLPVQCVNPQTRLNPMCVSMTQCPRCRCHHPYRTACPTW